MFQDWGSCAATVKDANGNTEQIATLKCVPVVFHNVIDALLLFVGATSLFFIIYAGIRFVTSGGDPKQVASARQIMTYAIIGLIIVLSSFGIIFFIAYVTKANCITNVNSMVSGCQ